VPGIHFIHSPTNLPREHLVNAALDALCHDRDYQRENVYRDNSAIVGVTRYPAYPVAVFGDDDYSILLEGYLYDISEDKLESAVLSFAPLLFGAGKNRSTAIKTWHQEHDGEYTILVRQDRTGDWALLNDPLARLPVYFCRDGDRSFLTREVRFILPFLKEKHLDRMAVAQQLLFEYPLGSRTLYAGVESVPPATLTVIERNGTVSRLSFDHSNFDAQDSRVSIRSEAERLADHYVSACRRRGVVQQKCIVGLSGGHDSRAVAAGLKKAGVAFQAVTFETDIGGNKADVAVSQQVAEVLGIERQLLKLSAPTGRDIRELLAIKGGLNYLAVAFGIPYLRSILREYGRDIVYFTGDGGHQVVPNLLPARRFTTKSQLVDFAIQRNYAVPLNTAAALTGLEVDAITEELAKVFGSYPEQPRSRYVRFHLYGRALRWLHEGEDRNRCFFWSTTPFYASPFFAEAMAVSPGLKRNHRLYCEFLRALSPDMVRIDDANRGAAVSSVRYRWMMAAITILNRYPSLLRKIRSRLHPRSSLDTQSVVVRCLHDQVRNNERVFEYLQADQLKTLLEHPGTISREGLYNLLTVTSIVDRLFDDEDTLLKYEHELFE
jgi:asparagine synthase (glutamine-hydrolysing)